MSDTAKDEHKAIADTMSVSELVGKKFFIPGYQRPYKWGEQQVTDLLQDIYDFVSDKSAAGFYCLQPVVVKNNGDEYELIDGQQRITTLRLIIKALNKIKSGSPVEDFEIKYETRQPDKFYENLGELIDDTIDSYHMSRAYIYILNWFGELAADDEKRKILSEKNKFKQLDQDKKDQRLEAISSIFVTGNSKVQVIWYQPDKNEDSIKLFLRLNSGKIPLTPAELIRAVFINAANKLAADDPSQQMLPFRIATEWDQMEQKLRDDDFWYFISNEDPGEVRIDYLFKILGLDHIALANKLKSGSTVVEQWSEVRDHFDMLTAWYDDAELYHMIGFLLKAYEVQYNCKKLNQLCVKWKENSKKQFWLIVKSYIVEKVMRKDDLKFIDKIGYDNDKQRVRDVLFLYNLMLCIKGKQRFRFKWFSFNESELEHICPQADSESKNNKEDWANLISENIKMFDWLDFSKELGIDYDGNVENMCNKLKNLDNESYQRLGNIIKSNYEEVSDVDRISNICLLESSLNKSVSNRIFSEKRQIIRQLSHHYLPPGTERVFNKLFKPNYQNPFVWSKKDAAAYLQDIKDTLQEFLNPPQD